MSGPNAATAAVVVIVVVGGAASGGGGSGKVVFVALIDVDGVVNCGVVVVVIVDVSFPLAASSFFVSCWWSKKRWR